MLKLASLNTDQMANGLGRLGGRTLQKMDRHRLRDSSINGLDPLGIIEMYDAVSLSFYAPTPSIDFHTFLFQLLGNRRTTMGIGMAKHCGGYVAVQMLGD